LPCDTARLKQIQSTAGMDAEHNGSSLLLSDQLKTAARGKDKDKP
jgi:hypothetical protein